MKSSDDLLDMDPVDFEIGEEDYVVSPDPDEPLLGNALTEKVFSACQAGFGGLFIQTSEMHEVIKSFRELSLREGWRIYKWDLVKKLKNIFDFDLGAEKLDLTKALMYLSENKLCDQEYEISGDPADHIELPNVDGLEPEDVRELLVIVSGDRMLADRNANQAMYVECLRQVILEGSFERNHVVILGQMGSKLPPELQKLCFVVEHEMPTREELWNRGVEIINEFNEQNADDPVHLPEDPDKLRLVKEASAGMTYTEYEGAIGLLLQRRASLEPSEIWKVKEKNLKASGLLTARKSRQGFEALGGLDHLKDFAKKSFDRSHLSKEQQELVSAKGVLLLGVQGAGKTFFSECLGYEVGRPVVDLDIGRLMGGIVGDTEANTRRAFSIIDAMSPCILIIDEVDKALGNVTKGTNNDVTQRLYGAMLTWLNDHESDVYVVMTANDASVLPGPLTRAERFDATFFFDVPTKQGRDVLWKMYMKKFNIDPRTKRPDDDSWTGAEIAAACRLSVLQQMPLHKTGDVVIPAAITDAEEIARCRAWADNRCLSADYDGKFQLQKAQKLKESSTTRKVDVSNRKRTTKKTGRRDA